MEEHIPYWEMEPADELALGGDPLPVGIGSGRTIPLGPQVFAKRGEVYAVYLPTCSSTGTLDLTDLSGLARQRWFNPRTGKFEGSSKIVSGGARLDVGQPPSKPDLDWVVLIERKENLSSSEKQFPGNHWETCSPESVGLDPSKLDEFVQGIGGDGCIVRDGYLVKTWGHYDANADWASAAKPLLSTLLLLAVQEGRLESVDALVKDVGWPLSEKDASMTFRHLANMVSGYACGEAPGEAWGYNDFAIQLYARSLEKIFQQPLNQAFTRRLSVLKFEDGKIFGSRNGAGVTASPRDFARLGLLWLNRGKWKGEQLIQTPLINEFLRSGVPANLPRTSISGTDYLKIGSYGGVTNQTPYGPGGYGFNLWFNSRQATGELAWPDIPTDTYQANGMWNRDTVTVIPSLRMVVAVRGAKQTSFEPGNPANRFNQIMSLLEQANTKRKPPAKIQETPLE